MNPGNPSKPPTSRWQRALSMPYLVGWILGGIFLFLGIIIVAVAGEPLMRYVSSFWWERVPGVVHSAEMTTQPTRRGHSLQGFLRVQVHFRHGDREWVATRPDIIEMGDLDLSRVSARLEALSKQSHVQVLVDPSDPTRSVLSRGSLGPVLLHFLILIFPAIGVGALIVTGLCFAYTEAGRPRRGFLGWWGNLGNRILESGGLEKWTIRILVLVPMLMVLLGALYQNWIVAGVGAFIGWGVWQAARKRPNNRRR